MRKIDLDFRMYLLTCVILLGVCFELFIPFFNYYLGEYTWWFCLANVSLFLIFNWWQQDVSYKLDYSFEKRNANFILSLIAIVVATALVLFFEIERKYFELSSNIGGHWVEKEIFWDLIVLLLVNSIILTEKPFFEKIGSIIDDIRSGFSS